MDVKEIDNYLASPPAIFRLSLPVAPGVDNWHPGRTAIWSWVLGLGGGEVRVEFVKAKSSQEGGTMCRYSLVFHCACHHQQMMMVEYCEKAVPAVPTFLACEQLQRSASVPEMAATTTSVTTSAPSESTPAALSAAALQNITECSRSPDDHHVGTDGRRMTSHGSTEAASDAEGPLKLEDLDKIEAEINTMKEEVQTMRAAQRQQEPAVADQRPKRTYAEATKIPAPVSSRPATKMSSQSKLSTQEDIAQYPASSIPTMRTHAQAGSSKLPGPAAAESTPRIVARESPPVSATSETSSGSFAQATSSTGSESGTQQKYYDAAEHQQETTPSPDNPATAGKSPDKLSPHFAQPTQATTRRIDQTLRSKDSSPIKSSPEVSTGKSTKGKGKAPQLETDKRATQRQQKRTSLPEGWMPTQEQGGSAEKSMEAEQKRSDDTESLPAEQTQRGTPLRKKTSSYMSPTKSAQHRTVATIGQESPGRISPRVKARGLHIDTAIAAKSMTISPSSPLRAGANSSSDDAFFSPRSHLSSNSSSKGKSRSPKKTAMSQTQLLPSPIERPSSGMSMRPPMPLREVKNTVIIRRDSDEDLLDPIKEKLDKEDLLKRDSTQEQRSTGARRGSRGEMLKPVYDRLKRVEQSPELASRSIFKNRRPEGSDSERKRSHAYSASTPTFPSGSMLRGSVDPSNDPISRLITGLRGQSSAEIGKALAGDHQETWDTPSSSSQRPHQVVDPAIMYQGQKPRSSGITSPPQDSAILYQGGKPSNDVVSYQDPAERFSSGYMRIDDVLRRAGRLPEAQPSSLRATAGDFVPSFAPVFDPEPTFQYPQYQDDMWIQPDQVQGYYFGDPYENVQTSDPYGMAHSYDDYHQSPHATWHGASFQRGYDSSPPERHFAGIQDVNDIRLPAAKTAETPSVSPTSSDTSAPSSRQLSSRASSRWTITGKSRRVYLWTGSDGLEVGFNGHGPDAEHDPNSPVLYRNLRAKTKTIHLEAASFPRDHKAGMPVPPNAPKSMRQYAESMNLSKIPCLDIKWQGKYDQQTPAVSEVPGCCASCKEGDNQLHRIGGGIEIAQY
ncbi:hypothetical protein Q7P37_004368 [Cladosporium fusiforme]